MEDLGCLSLILIAIIFTVLVIICTIQNGELSYNQFTLMVGECNYSNNIKYCGINNDSYVFAETGRSSTNTYVNKDIEIIKVGGYTHKIIRIDKYSATLKRIDK